MVLARSGLAVASKYNSGLVLVPCALAIVFRGDDRKGRKLLLIGGAAAAAFFVCVPYSLLEPVSFHEDVMFEIDHYRTGHPDSEVEPGLEQLAFYWSSLGDDFGAPLLGLAVVGVAYGLLTDRSRTPRSRSIGCASASG